MALTVLSVAYPMAAVGPDAVGGAEQVLTLLDEALVSEREESVVVASRGSRCWGALIPTPRPRAPFTEPALREARRAHREAIEWALRRWPVDVIHLHGIDFLEYLPPPGSPAVVTLHLPPSWYPAQAFQPARPNTWLVCVSESQRLACPKTDRLLGVVPNGIRLEQFRPRGHKRAYALALQRICPEKGAHLALAAAREAGAPLILAGEIHPYPAHEQYFREEVAPLLDGERRFLGPVGLERKRRLLAGARCVLVPSLAEETSSLVVMEALASGTPVVAFRRGALPDLVDDGKTGFLVDGVPQMAEAIRRAGALRPEDCRRAAEQRFSSERMARGYLEVYRRLAGSPSGERSTSAQAGAPRELPAGEGTGAGSRPVRSSLRVEEVATLHDLERLAPRWSELFERSAGATPFQHPDWLLPWCRRFPPSEPWALLLLRGERLVGLAPLLIYRSGEQRVATLMGTGVSDFTDALLDDEVGEAGAGALLHHLLRKRRRWDACVFEQLRAGSALLRALRSSGARLELAPQDRCLALRLPRDGDLASAIPWNLGRNLRRYRRRAEALGAVRFERCAPEGVEEGLAALVRLHGARWESRGQAGVLGAEIAEFHREVMTRFAAARRLVLTALRVGDRTAAVLYGFLGRDRMYLYLMGMEPSLDRISPGTLVLGHFVEEALQLGLREVDMLRGAEGYKYLWGPVERISWRATLHPE